MKAKREHLVPLCRRAVQLLEAAQALHKGSELVFPSPHGHVIAYRAFYQILQAVRSPKLFSLAALYDANKELLRPVLERGILSVTNGGRTGWGPLLRSLSRDP